MVLPPNHLSSPPFSSPALSSPFHSSFLSLLLLHLFLILQLLQKTPLTSMRSRLAWLHVAAARCSPEISQQALASRHHKELKTMGICCQPHSLGAVHRGWKRIMKVGGLKIKFKKYAKMINHKIRSFTLIGERTPSAFLFSPLFPHLCKHRWLESWACVMACQEASQKYIHQSRGSVRWHYI